MITPAMVALVIIPSLPETMSDWNEWSTAFTMGFWENHAMVDMRTVEPGRENAVHIPIIFVLPCAWTQSSQNVIDNIFTSFTLR